LPTKGSEDRRIQKTHNLLRGALVALIAEKPYDSIVVKEILDRANVGRSTFYTHFRDKDDLLVSGIQDMLGPVPSPTHTRGRRYAQILWFSLPVFEHHYRHAHAWGDRIGARGRAILHEHLRRVLTDIITEVMKNDSPPGRQSARQIQPELVSAYIASTFVLVLNWWLDKRMRLSPKEIDEVFRRLTLPTLEAVCDRSGWGGARSKRAFVTPSASMFAILRSA
jgi:AcrR family transcriptional regulator